MTTQHTPGPLKASGSMVFTVDGALVAESYGHTANAEHVVCCWNACEGINPEAVPDLLAACEHLDVCMPHDDVCARRGHGAAECTCIVADVRAAIAKAKGE